MFLKLVGSNVENAVLILTKVNYREQYKQYGLLSLEYQKE